MHQSSFFHVDIGALTSHNTSKTLWRVRLSYSWLSGLNFSFSTFFSLFVFMLVWVLFACFLWTLAVAYMHTSLYENFLIFHCYLIVVTCMKLFCTNGRQFSDSLHPHACWSIFWIFHSMCTCMINHLCFHLVSPCIHFHIHFQLPVGKFGQPWPRLYLTKIALRNPRKEGFIFLSRNVHFFPSTILEDCFAHFWGIVTTSPENCAMQSLSLQSLLVWIVHCTIPAISCQPGLYIVQIQQLVNLPR